MNYLWNILEATSQWLNALLGGNPNITISAAAYLNRHGGHAEAARNAALAAALSA